MFLAGRCGEMCRAWGTGSDVGQLFCFHSRSIKYLHVLSINDAPLSSTHRDFMCCLESEAKEIKLGHLCHTATAWRRNQGHCQPEDWTWISKLGFAILNCDAVASPVASSSACGSGRRKWAP